VFTLDKIAEFYYFNSEALWFIYLTDFQSIEFYLISLTSSYNNLEKKMDVKKLTTLSRLKHY